MDLNFKKENFSIQTMNITEDGDGWSGLLREVFISDATMAQNYRTLVGHIRIPEIQKGDNKPRCKMVNIEDPRCIVQRLVYLQTFSNYLKAHNLKGTDFKYVIITYTGAIESEWFAYANLLMKFVDYILPYLVKNINGITVDNLVFTEHAKPNVGNTTFHILFTAQEATEFQQLWTMYIDFTERRKIKPETEEKKESDSSQENKAKNEDDSSDNSQRSQADDNTSEKNNSDSQIPEKEESTQLPPGVKIDSQTGEVIEENSQDESKVKEQINEDDIPDPNDLDDDENFNHDEDEEDFDENGSDDDSEQDTNLQAISFNDSDDEEYAETEDDEGGD